MYAEPIPPIETKLKDAIKTEKGIDISETEADDAAQLIPCNISIPKGMNSSNVNISTLDEELEAKAERKRMRQVKRDRKSLITKRVDSFDWLAPPPAHPAAHISGVMTSKSTRDKVESSGERVMKEEFCDTDVLPDEDEEEERLKEERRCHRQERRERKRARREAREMS